jgi:putative flippase GtrA
VPLSRQRRVRLRELLRHPLAGRWFRYSAGSVVSFGVSELTLVLLFEPHILGAKGAAGVASLAGVIPGYFLNRNWAWGRRGRSDLLREVLPYWVTIAVTTVLAALIIGGVNDAAISESRTIRTAINAGTYLVVYLFFFVAKFMLFQRWLFRPAAPDAPDAVVVDLTARGVARREEEEQQLRSLAAGDQA